MRMFLIPVLLIFVASCTQNTPSQTDVCVPVICKPIYGHTADWDVISDDLARNIYRHNRMCADLNK